MRLRLVLALALAAASVPCARAADLNVITAVEVRDEGASVVLSVKGSRKPSFTTFSMADPPRFVIDFSESRFEGVPEDIRVQDGTVNLVKNLSYGSDATSIARVMVAFQVEVAPPVVEESGGTLRIRVEKPSVPGAPVARAPAPAAAPEAAPSVAAAVAAAVAKSPDAAPVADDSKARAEAEARAAEQAAADARAAAEASARAEAQAKAQAETDAKARAEAEARAAERAAADARAAAEASARAEQAKAQAAPLAVIEPAEPAASPAPEARAEAPAAPAPAAEAPAPAEPAARPDASARVDASAPAARVREVGFKQLPGASRVFVRTTVPPRFTIQDVAQDTIRVELENTRVDRRNDLRFLDTSFFKSAVARVTPSRHGSSYVLDIKLRERVPYQQRIEGDALAIDFERPASTVASSAPAAGAAAPGEAEPEAPAAEAAEPAAAPAQ